MVEQVLTESELVRAAAAYAREVHAGDVRKGSGAPYFDAHLAEVAAIVADAGGDEIQVAAAYLHDTAEDHGGRRRLADLLERFGPEVTAIVEDLSDSLVDTETGGQKAPWHERKQAYVAAMADKPERSLVVAAADKLQNVRCMVDDLRSQGAAVWQRFTTSDPADHRWYYRSLADTLRARLGDHPTAVALDRAVAELEVESAAEPA